MRIEILIAGCILALLAGCVTERPPSGAVAELPVMSIANFKAADARSFLSSVRRGMTMDDFDRIVREHQSNGFHLTEFVLPIPDGRLHMRVSGDGIYAFDFGEPWIDSRRQIRPCHLRFWSRWTPADDGCLAYTNKGLSAIVCPVR